MLSARPRLWRLGHIALVAVGGFALVLLLVLLAPGASPALAVTMATPYPAMTVQSGQSVTLDLTVRDDVAERLDLSVEGLPSGWTATVLGGGRPVTAVIADPEQSPRLQLQVDIPGDAAEGTSTITVVARSARDSASLPISLTVSKVTGAATTMQAEYSSLRGPATATYTFSLSLANGSPEAHTYNLSASGPENWSLSLKPSGSTQETPTVSVEPQGSQQLNLTVTPGPDAQTGTYDLTVTAVGGGETVSAPLQIEITGTYTLSLTTPDGRLNADVKAGGTTRVPFVVTNSGTGPLQGVQLSASPPANWEVAFEPRSIDVLPPNQEQSVVAVFTPAENAIAGDYVVTIRATADQAVTQADIRVTVKTSTLWGVIGICIAVAAIAILGLVFRRFGHR